MTSSRTFLLFFIMFSCLIATAQKKERHISIGGNFSVPYNLDPGNNDIRGIGVDIKGERVYNKHFTGSVSIGFNRFIGTLYNFWDSTKSNSFSNIPVLLGLRYYFSKIYLGFETGECFAASHNNRSHVVVAPSAGVSIKKLDVGIKLTHVIGGFEPLESTTLQSGEYDYLSLRIAWRLK